LKQQGIATVARDAEADPVVSNFADDGCPSVGPVAVVDAE